MDQSSTYRKDKSTAVAWFATAIGSAAIAACVAAHGKMWAHDVSIERNIDRIQAQEKRLDSMDTKLDRILEELRRRP